MCVYMHAYIETHTPLHICKKTYMHARMHTCVHNCIPACLPVYLPKEYIFGTRTRATQARVRAVCDMLPRRFGPV